MIRSAQCSLDPGQFFRYAEHDQDTHKKFFRGLSHDRYNEKVPPSEQLPPHEKIPPQDRVLWFLHGMIHVKDL